MYNRAASERGMAAMSLAAHLFRHGKRAVAGVLEELATKLPRVPVDPWGDGKETLGYVVMKGGLPDGSDRPLVYARCDSPTACSTGWIPRSTRSTATTAPTGPGTETRGGQFRDVTRWTPRPCRRGDSPAVNAL